MIFYMDGLGIQPTLVAMSRRLAESGYVVLLPDLYCRPGLYSPLDPKAIFASGNVRGAIPHLRESTDKQRAGNDTKAFPTYLSARPDVLGKKVGAIGYCMGGGMALTAAGTYPGSIAAAASFHGGPLSRSGASGSALHPYPLYDTSRQPSPSAPSCSNDADRIWSLDRADSTSVAAWAQIRGWRESDPV